jgi:hypothetical protein
LEEFMPESRARQDGRKPLLVYLDPELIRSLKIQAATEQTHVYLIVEEALKARGGEAGSPARSV